jgi:hypothetical protein
VTDYRIDSMYDGRSYKVDHAVGVLGTDWFAAWTDGRNETSDVFVRRPGGRTNVDFR